MKEIELVIKIPEETYKGIMLGKWDENGLAYYVKDGTPLPKGHGRIGDLDRLYNVFDKNVVSADAFKELFDHAPTIVEADEVEE